jgi:hypothetical protein
MQELQAINEKVKELGWNELWWKKKLFNRKCIIRWMVYTR